MSEQAFQDTEVSTLKGAIVNACRRLDQRSFVANHDGNITAKLKDGFLLATPTSFAKADVTEDDLLIIDPSNKVVEGKHKVFSEIHWHRAIYRARPDVRVVVHGHPVTASGYGLAGLEIGTPAVPEAIVSLGRAIVTIPFYSPLDEAIQRESSTFENSVSLALKESDAFIAPGNGVWAAGSEVLQAYLRLELVEHIALQHMVAEKLGTIKKLKTDLVEQLMQKRPPRSAPVSASTAPSTSPSVASSSGSPRPLNSVTLPDSTTLKSLMTSQGSIPSQGSTRSPSSILSQSSTSGLSIPNRAGSGDSNQLGIDQVQDIVRRELLRALEARE